MDGQAWIDDYGARMAALGGRAAAASGALAGIAATASSRDGAATVTVDAVGGLQELRFSRAAARLDRAQLAEAVLEAARRARERAAGEAVAAVAPLVGPHSPAMGMLRERLPAAVDR